MNRNFKVMSAKVSLSGNDVKNSGMANIKENLKTFSVDGHKSFVKIWKQISEVNFQNKNLRISNYPNKFGKLMFCVKDSNILNI